MQLWIAAMLLFGFGITATNTLHGQFRTDPRHAAQARNALPLPELESLPFIASEIEGGNSLAMGSATLPAVLTGSTVGAAVGTAAGMGMGLLLFHAGGAPGPDESMFGPLPHMALLGIPGAAVGSWVGSRWANQGRGNPWATAAGSVLGVVSGVALGLATGDTGLGFAVAIPLTVGLPALVEVATTR